MLIPQTMLLLAVLTTGVLTPQVTPSPSPSPAPQSTSTSTPSAEPSATAVPTVAPEEATPTPELLTLNNGPCLDSALSVPHPFNGTGRAADVVKIDKVVSTSPMMKNETIGFLYTREDGTQWLGQRDDNYTSPASSQTLNALLSAAKVPGVPNTTFPATRHLGLKTAHPTIFQINLTPDLELTLFLILTPCIAWPANSELPN